MGWPHRSPVEVPDMTLLDPHDFHDRTDVMRRDAFIVGIVGFGAANGMHFSPYFDPAFLIMRPFVQVTFFASSPIIIFYFTSLVLATFSIMLAGVPAALYERAKGLTRSNATSFGIWFAFMALITLPTVMNLAKRGGG
jgi:hypothetical protein